MHFCCALFQVIYSRFGRIIMLHDAPTEKRPKTCKRHHQNNYINGCPKDMTLLHNMTESEPNIPCMIQYDTVVECASGCRASVQMKKITEELKALRSNLRSIAEQTNNNNYKKKSSLVYKKDWELFGIFLDRMFCILYIILAVLGLVFFFPIPHNTESYGQNVISNNVADNVTDMYNVTDK